MMYRIKNIQFFFGLSLKWIVILLFILTVINGCKQGENKQGKPVIAVSILPQKYFVEKIAGDKYHIVVMIPPGSGHENYDPTPSQLIQLSDAVVYFRNGYLDFENTWVEKFIENYPDLKFINLSKGLDLMETMDTDHHHGSIDPHTWMSPTSVKEMARTIFETFVEIDNKNKEFYSINYSAFRSELDSLESYVIDKFRNSGLKSFIIYHPALTYYARDFGLKQYAVEMEGKTPSAYHIRALTDIANRENIRAILIQKQYDKSRAETLALETGCKIIEIDPLNENWGQEILDITNNLSSAFDITAE
jgi:zinc transport system substrate-binding protein